MGVEGEEIPPINFMRFFGNYIIRTVVLLVTVLLAVEPLKRW